MVSLGKSRNKHARQAAEGLDSDTCTAARNLSSLSGRTFPGPCPDRLQMQSWVANKDAG